MSANEIVRAVLIHLVTPAAGLAFYLWLCTHLRRQVSPETLYASYFFLFFVLGGWLMILLTALFWSWSGMASIGALFLTFVSPFIAIIIAFGLRRFRSLSSFHRWAFRLIMIYAVAIVVLDVIWLGWGADHS